MPTKKVIHKNVDEIQSQNAAVLNIDATVGKLDSIPSMAIQNLTDGQILTFSQTDGAFVNTNASLAGAGAVNVSDLLDVDAPTPTHGQALTWNLPTQKWVAATVTGSGGGGGTSNVANLNDLTDVTATSPSLNQVLAWSGTEWTPANPATATAAVLTSSGITFDDSSGDNEYIYGSAPQITVNISSPQDQQALVYDAASGDWVNGAAVSAGAADLGIAVTTAGSDIDYDFNSPTPQGYPSVDTSTLATGSTMMWDGSNWVNSGLIIESYT